METLPNPPTPSVQPGTGYQPNPADILKQQHAETANKLAIALIAILAGTVALHYACVFTLALFKHDEVSKSLEDVFHTWVPVLAGLTGSAVTYYFTKGDKS